MHNNQHITRKIALLSGVAILAITLAGPSLAASPYYFVDDAGNSNKLYTDDSCDGSQYGCVGFVYACGTQIYSTPQGFENGKDTLKYKGKINIRQNSGSYEVVCVVE